MESIALKEKALNYSIDFDMTKDKFRSSISDSLVSIEDLVMTNNMISNEYGIMANRPSLNRVYTEDFTTLRNRINRVKSLGELGIYNFYPYALTQKSLPDVIEYCQKNGIPYKDEKGNYSYFVFSKREYEKMGILVDKEEVLTSEEPVTNIESLDSVDNTSFANEFNEKLENELAEPVQEEPLDPIQKILKADGNAPIDNDHIQRIDALSDILKSVLTELYNMSLRNNDLVSDVVATNLVKLIMADVPDDRLVIYSALVYGDKFTQTEVDTLPSIIVNKLNYVTINDLSEEGMSR